MWGQGVALGRSKIVGDPANYMERRETMARLGLARPAGCRRLAAASTTLRVVRRLAGPDGAAAGG